MNGNVTATTPDVLEAISRILIRVGDQSLSLFESIRNRHVESKSQGDFVSDADGAVEVSIRKLLSREFPNDVVLGEEFGGKATDRYWIVDPIDGTSNFLSGLPFWSISIGLVENGIPTVGAVYAPALDSMVVGAEGVGFHESGLKEGSRPLVPKCIAVGRNGKWQSNDRYRIEQKFERKGLNVISLGSCALSLLYVASGRASGYVEKRVGGIWDCAGGIAICRANGIHASFSCNDDGSINVYAGDASLFCPTNAAPRSSNPDFHPIPRPR